MFNTVRQKIIAFLRDAAFRRRRRQFLFVLAAFTVFCTTYMLILPAITLDSQGGGTSLPLNEALANAQDDHTPHTTVTSDPEETRQNIEWTVYDGNGGKSSFQFLLAPSTDNARPATYGREETAKLSLRLHSDGSPQLLTKIFRLYVDFPAQGGILNDDQAIFSYSFTMDGQVQNRQTTIHALDRGTEKTPLYYLDFTDLPQGENTTEIEKQLTLAYRNDAKGGDAMIWSEVLDGDAAQEEPNPLAKPDLPKGILPCALHFSDAVPVAAAETPEPVKATVNGVEEAHSQTYEIKNGETIASRLTLTLDEPAYLKEEDKFLTGEETRLTFSVDNPASGLSNNLFRVYFDFSEAGGNFNNGATTIQFSSQQGASVQDLVAHKVERADGSFLYYIDIDSVDAGKTLSAQISLSYPNRTEPKENTPDPTKAGGNITVWAEVLPKSPTPQAPTENTKKAEDASSLEADFVTVRKESDIQKTANTQPATVEQIFPSSCSLKGAGFSYQSNAQPRSSGGQTLPDGLGVNPVKEITYEDTITLENAQFTPGLLNLLSTTYQKIDKAYWDDPVLVGKTITLVKHPAFDNQRIIYYKDTTGVHTLISLYGSYLNEPWNHVYIKKNTDDSITIKITFLQSEVKDIPTWEFNYDPAVGVPFDRLFRGLTLESECVIEDDSKKKITVRNQITESAEYTFAETSLPQQTKKENPRQTMGKAVKDATWNDATYELNKYRWELDYEQHVFGKVVPFDFFLTIKGIGKVKEPIKKLEDTFSAEYYFTPAQIAGLFSTVGNNGDGKEGLFWEKGAYNLDRNDYLTLRIQGANFIERNENMPPLYDIHGNAVSTLDVQYFDDDGRHDDDYGKPDAPTKTQPKVGEITFKKLANGGLEGIITVGTQKIRKEMECTKEAVRAFLADTYEEAGKTWSFLVSNGTRYTVTYDFTGASAVEGRTLTDRSVFSSGESWGKRIEVTLKDSFMRLSMDLEGYYHTSTDKNRYVHVNPNQAHLTAGDKVIEAKALVPKYTNQGYNAYIDFQIKKFGQTEADGRIRYQVDVTKTDFAGVPEALPLTDFLPNPGRVLLEMSEIEALKANGKLTDGDVQTAIFGGVTYAYITKPGTYAVTIDGKCVNLTIQSDGTLLRWIGRENDWGNAKQSAAFSYSVALLGVEPVGNKFLNHVFLGDQEGRRLTAAFGLGMKLNSGKEIVRHQDANGDPNKDILDKDGFSLLRRGDTVTYRIPLQAISQWNLYREKIWDRLPQGVNWTKENVHVRTKIEDHYGRAITFAPGAEQSWRITNIDPETKQLTPTQQYLVWTKEDGSNNKENFATFGRTGMAYLYVTLDYPQEEADWQAFLASGETKNTAVVEGQNYEVKHDKETPITGIFEKDVVGSRTIIRNTGGRYFNVLGKLSAKNDPRTVLNNDSYRNGTMQVDSYVAYQVLIANRGTRRLFLDDVMDTLPEGFTYAALVDPKRDEEYQTYMRECNSIVTMDFAQYHCVPDKVDIQDMTSTPLTKRNVKVEAIDSKTGKEPETDHGSPVDAVQFRLTVGEATTDGFKLDEERYGKEEGRSFLLPGEYILFHYYARTNRYNATQDEARNVMGMKILDEGSVEPQQKNDVLSYTGKEGDNETVVSYNTVNRGSRNTRAESDAAQQASGWKSTVNGNYWWHSDVTVRREEKIGFTKNVKSEGIVAPNADVTWILRPLPKGAGAVLAEPTIVDRLPKAYSLKEIHIQNKQVAGYNVKQFINLKVEKIDEKTRKITYNGSGWGSKTLTIQANDLLQTNDQETLSIDTGYDCVERYLKLQMAFRLNADGAEEWKFKFGGQDYGETDAPTLELVTGPANQTTVKDGKHINTAWLYPQQDFPQTKFSGDGTYTTDELQVMNGVPAVKDKAEVLALGPYATVSTKRLILHPADTTKEATVAESGDSLVVSSPKGDSLEYVLEVDNPNEDKTIDSLVVIDTLPRVGDTAVFDPNTPRNSDFPIYFDENKFYDEEKTRRVKLEVVYPGPGGTIMPAASDYRVEYKDSATITKDDREGKPSAEWKTTPDKNTRAVRIVIGEKFALRKEEIPPKTKIRISFFAKLDPQQKRSDVMQTAWNSFGYTYTMKDHPAALSASPDPVGARLTENPKVTKKIIRAVEGDKGLLPDVLKTTQRYVYLLTEGNLNTKPGWNLQNLEESDIIRKLKQGNKKYVFFGVDVPAGQSDRTVPLNDTVFSDFFGDRQIYSLYEVTTVASFLYGKEETAVLFDPSRPQAGANGVSLATQNDPFVPLNEESAQRKHQGKKFAYADFYDEPNGVSKTLPENNKSKVLIFMDANAESTHFVYQNRTESWNIAVIKQEAGAPVKTEPKTLPKTQTPAMITGYPRYIDGALFALYSPNEADKISEEAYAEAKKNGAPQGLEKELTGWEGEKTFYLMKVAKAETAPDKSTVYRDAKGNKIALPYSLFFAGLDQDCYVVKEISGITGYSNRYPSGALLYRHEPANANRGDNGEDSPNLVGLPSMIQQASPGSLLSAWPKLVDSQGGELSDQTLVSLDPRVDDKTAWYLVGNARSETKELPGLGGRGKEIIYGTAMGVIFLALAYIGYAKSRKEGKAPKRGGG